MNSPPTWLLLLVLVCALASHETLVAQVTENAQKAEIETEGKLTQFVFEDSIIFPGNKRDVWVYIPEQ